MMNPHYHPDRAHLPNAEDMRKWRNGGKKKEMRERARVAATIERFARNAK